MKSILIDVRFWRLNSVHALTRLNIAHKTHQTSTQCLFNVGPSSGPTLKRHCVNTCVCWKITSFYLTSYLHTGNTWWGRGYLNRRPTYASVSGIPCIPCIPVCWAVAGITFIPCISVCSSTVLITPLLMCSATWNDCFNINNCLCLVLN